MLYALLGSSRHLVVSPMSATAALSAARSATFAHGSADYVALTAALAWSPGVALVAGLLRLGFLASMISEPVLKGFIIGLALTILVGPAAHAVRGARGDGSFFEKLWDLVTELGDTSAQPDRGSAEPGPAARAAPLGAEGPRLAGRRRCSAIVVASVFDLGDHGLELVGTIDAGLPPFGLPDVGLHGYLDLVGPAAGVMLVGFAEGLGAAKTYAAKAGLRRSTATASCSGSALANLGAGLCSGMVVNGSLSKTAVNGGAGARSQLSGVTAAVAHGGHAAVPDRAVRAAAGGDARGGRHRRGDRAGRHRRR